MRELNITTREEGQRLDKILSKYLNKAPKSFVYKMLRKKNIKLNGKKATGNEKLSQGDQVCIYLAEDTINKFREEVKAGKQKIKLDVLYEDENVIMVNKPWGILSQKSKPEDISINDQIIPYAVNQGLISEKELQVVKPSICNRLDRNTTGIIICGISIEGLQTMAEMLKHRDMEEARKSCEQLLSQPFTLLNYLEGTRFTAEKHAQQQSTFTNLLKPKAGGLALALNILGDQIDALVDMTIVYPDGVPGYGEFWLGEVPRIAVNLRKIDIPAWVAGGNYEEDAEFREKFQQWVDQIWTDKDQLISEMKAKYPPIV